MISLVPTTPHRAAMRAVLLAVLIPVGLAAAHCAEATGRLDRSLASNVFEVERDWMRFHATYLPGGALDVRSPLGRFEGRWMTVGDELCIAFESGPAMGQRCATVEVSDGAVLALSNGVTMHRIAKAQPLAD